MVTVPDTIGQSRFLLPLITNPIEKSCPRVVISKLNVRLILPKHDRTIFLVNDAIYGKEQQCN